MKKKIVIFGAGISGLSAARELARSGFEVQVVEKSNMLGGLSGTYHDDDGFIYDKGPHYFFTTLADKIGIRDMCVTVPYYEAIFHKGKYYSFPFGLLFNWKFFLSVGWAFFRRAGSRKDSYQNLKVLLEKNYGSIFTKEILSPLLEKWAGFKVDMISQDFGQRLLPGNLKYILYSLIKKIRGYTEDYYEKGRYIVYPKGGMRTLFEKLAGENNIKIDLGVEVSRIAIAKNRVEGAKAGSLDLDGSFYLSSIPVDQLISASNYNASLNERLGKFKYRGIVILYVKIDQRTVLDKLWYWFPSPEFPFYRVSEQNKDIYPANSAAFSKSIITFEFGTSQEEGLWKKTDKEIFEMGQDYLAELFSVPKEKILGYRVERSPSAYPILLKDYEEQQRNLQANIGYNNLFLTGRTGLFKYYMLEESYDSAIKSSEFIKNI
jgi:protoporphyrinogen oxidase